MGLYFQRLKNWLRRLASLSLHWRVVIRPNLWRVAALLSIGLFGSLTEVLVLGITVPILDVVSHADRLSQNRLALWTLSALQWMGLPTHSNAVLFALIIVASLLFLLRSALEVTYQYWSAAISLRIKLDTRSLLFARSLRTPYEVLTRLSRGAILNDIMQPSDAMNVAVKSLGILLNGMIKVVSLIGLMFYLSKTGTLLVTVFAGLGTFGWRKLLTRMSAARGHRVYEIQRGQSKIEVDTIDGIRVVKASVLEEELTRQHRDALEAEMKPTMEVTLFRNGPMVVNELIAFLIIASLGLFTFVWPVTGLTFSSLVAMLLTLRRMSPVLSEMNASTVELAKWQRGLEILEESITRPGEPLAGAPVETVQELALKGVSFRYATKTEAVLHQVSLVMNQGTVTAIVGSTGAGKSTIANLLLRYYDPSQGIIAVNGQPLPTYNLAAWRRKIGYVSQDVFLFNTTIEENISLWNPSVSLDQVRQAANIAQLDEFIVSLPTGYQTVVGDRGLRLSGGQCQRVAIARAVLRSPDVLILDEATSALDNLTEKAVYAAIQMLRRKSIVVVIAHRLSTVKDADQIVVLKGGRVDEIGRHQDLLQAAGTYAQLYGEEKEGVVSR